MSRILIAVPTFENILPDTFKSIYQLKKGDNEVDFDFFRGYDAAKARNIIAEAMLDGGYDYVLTIDSDEVIPQDGLMNLLESQERCKVGRTMVVGYCLSRPKNAQNTSGKTTVFRFGGKDYIVDNAYTAGELKALRDDGVTMVQVRGSGVGCALIHRSVFEQMSYPYFRWTEYSKGHYLSEDLFFCEKFPGINKPIYVDTRVACGHLMRYISQI